MVLFTDQTTNLFKDVPSMLMRNDGPLSIDFFYMIKNLNWALKFLRNSSRNNVNKISEALGNILKSASVSYDEIFSDVKVSQFIKNEEAIYLLTLLNIKRSNFSQAKELIDKLSKACVKICSSTKDGQGLLGIIKRLGVTLSLIHI